MNGWIFTAIAVCIAICVAGALYAARPSRRHRRYSDDQAHVFELHRKARLLGTIPSEHDLQRSPYERDQLSDISGPEAQEEDDEDRRHFMLLDFEKEERERLEIEREEEALEELFEKLTIEQCVAHECVEFNREAHGFEEKTDPVAVNDSIAEALHLVRILNEEYGWEAGQPRIADRMFNTNVMAVIANARNSQKVDFRLNKMIGTMRSFARAAHVGRSELSKVMATRILLGTGRMTQEEITSLREASELFGDNFAEAAGYADRLSRTQEIVKAKRLGIAPGSVTSADLKSLDQKSPVELDRNIGRTLSRGGRTP